MKDSKGTDERKPPHYSEECKVLSTVNYKHCTERWCENPLHLK